MLPSKTQISIQCNYAELREKDFVIRQGRYSKLDSKAEEVDIGQLDYFMHGLKRKTNRKKSIFRKKAQIYKAVSSTENETLLFPEHVDTEICRRIAICLTDQRTAH